MNAALIESARQAYAALPDIVSLRTGDALHLACARQHGFWRIYSSDRHLLAAATHFGLESVNPLAG